MFLALTLLLAFVGLPIVAVGVCLATAQRKTRVRILGGVIALLGSALVLLFPLYLYWVFFHSN